MPIITMDSQILNSIQLCPRLVKLRFVEHLVPNIKADYFETGDLMHELLRIYYTQKKVGDPFNKCVDDALAVVPLYTLKMNLSEEDVEETVYQFKEYTNHYRHESWRPLEIEQPFSKVMYNDNDLVIIYEGKIDLVVEANVPKLPVDHKTSKRRSETSSLSNQFLGYCWAVDSRNIVIDKIGYQKSLKPGERFERPVISYTKERIEEWVQNTINWAKMLYFHIESDHWPMNLTSCDKFAGCMYNKVCARDPEDRDRIILKEFKVEKWEPTKSLEKEVTNAT